MTLLHQLRPGERARIKEIAGLADSTFALRLQEMGLTVGSVVELAHTAPFGGAVAVRVRSTILAIRTSDARSILVERF